MILKHVVIIAIIASLVLISGCTQQESSVPELPVDSDGDGWSDSHELKAGTDPNNKDTDSDKYWDPLDENPLDSEIPVARTTPTAAATATSEPTPEPTPEFEITNPSNGDFTARLIDVKGRGGESGATVRIRVCTEEESNAIRSGVGHPDNDGNWEIESIGVWPVEGYISGESAVIYAEMTVVRPRVTTIYRSENVTVRRS